MVRKMAIVGFSYLAGLFCAPFLRVTENFAVGAILAAFSIVLLILLRGTAKAGIALSVLCAGVSLIIYAAYEQAVYQPLLGLNGAQMELSGVVLDKSRNSADMCTYQLRVRFDNGQTAKMKLYAPDSDAAYYDTVTFTAKLSVPQDTLTFPQRSYNKSQGFFLTATGESAPVIRKNPSLPPQAVLLRYRDYIKAQMKAILPNEQGALLIAILFGDKSGLSPQVKIDLNRSGIGHVASVSGLHLSIVAGFLMLLLEQLRVKRKIRVVVLLLIIAAFTVFSGMAVSAMRSALMMGVFYSGNLFRRRADTLNSIGLACFALCILSPYAARDTGLLLSITGTIGVGAVGPSLTKWLNKVKPAQGLVRQIRLLLLPSICALVCTFPIVLFTFDETSIISPVTNVLLLPLCSVALLCTVIFALAGGLSIVGVPLLFVGGLCCKGLLLIIEWVGNLRIAYVPLGTGFLAVWLIICVVAIGICAVAFRSWGRTLLCCLGSMVVLFFGGVSYELANHGNTTLTVLSDGRAAGLIVRTQHSAAIVQLKSGKQLAQGLAAQLRQQGIEGLSVLCLPALKQSELAIYAEQLHGITAKTAILPEGLAKESEKYGLFVGTEKLISGDMEILLDNGYTINICAKNTTINVGGFSLLCTDESAVQDTPTVLGFLADADKLTGGTNAAYTIVLGKGSRDTAENATTLYAEDHPVISFVIAPNGAFTLRRSRYGYFE